MNFKDWSELSLIAGTLEGMAEGIEQVKGDVNFESIVENLKKTSRRVLEIQKRNKPK